MKTEEVNGKAYASQQGVRRHIGVFIETIYNAGCLHLALGYKPPVEFKAKLRPTFADRLTAAATSWQFLFTRNRPKAKT